MLRFFGAQHWVYSTLRTTLQYQYGFCFRTYESPGRFELIAQTTRRTDPPRKTKLYNVPHIMKYAIASDTLWRHLVQDDCHRFGDRVEQRDEDPYNLNALAFYVRSLRSQTVSPHPLSSEGSGSACTLACFHHGMGFVG